MLKFPYAKINLGLRVIRKRHDGYHDIESLFYPLALHDVLEILPLAGNEKGFFRTSGLEVPGDDTNLSMKASSRLRLLHRFPEAGIYLHKTIPIGGGLGGGSSDGAFTLLALNELFSLNLSRESLMDHAGSLGSDCPFFISGTPSFVTGRGEKLETFSNILKGYYLLLVVPGRKVDTSYAYRMVKPDNRGAKVREIIQSPPGQWQGRIINDFEAPLFSEYPEMRAIKDRLYGSGAIYASMTGSGSGVYGIYENWPEIPLDFSRYFIHRERFC